jgi:hypothetical protein
MQSPADEKLDWLDRVIQLFSCGFINTRVEECKVPTTSPSPIADAAAAATTAAATPANMASATKNTNSSSRDSSIESTGGSFESHSSSEEYDGDEPLDWKAVTAGTMLMFLGPPIVNILWLLVPITRNDHDADSR